MKPRQLAMALVLVALVFGVIGTVLIWSRSEEPASDINSYEECVAAGGAIAESFPEQCFAPDGSRSFTNPAQAAPHID